MHNISFSAKSTKLMHYGIFTIICHATAILFLASLYEDMPPNLLFHRFFPMLEYSFISFIAILTGVLGLEYAEIKKSEKS